MKNGTLDNAKAQIRIMEASEGKKKKRKTPDWDAPRKEVDKYLGGE
jgi:hypothetical protein